MENELTPTAEDSLRQAINSVLASVNTSLPAEVLAYDSKTKMATIRPLVKLRKPDGTFIDRSKIFNVPCLFQSADGGKASLTMPIKKGDQCTAIFSQRSIDSWKSTGLNSEPATRERFSETDAVAIVGLQSSNNAVPADPNNVELKYNNAVISITPSGEVKIKAVKIAMGTEVVELLSTLGEITQLISGHIQSMASAVYPPPLGAASPPTLLQLGIELAQSKLLIQKLQSITGKI